MSQQPTSPPPNEAKSQEMNDPTAPALVGHVSRATQAANETRKLVHQGHEKLAADTQLILQTLLGTHPDGDQQPDPILNALEEIAQAVHALERRQATVEKYLSDLSKFFRSQPARTSR